MGRVVSGITGGIGGALGGVARAGEGVVGAVPGTGTLAQLSPLSSMGLGQKVAMGATTAGLGTGTGIGHVPTTWQMFQSDGMMNALSGQNEALVGALPDPGGFKAPLNAALGGTQLV
ncbi:MAG: hypothetical protein HY319_20920 [Armatimonadetes bacterium]|nr:hypothetical protein [Armatimonadota bacterium]